ncbi:MAG: hypothetical protein ACT4TC_02355 [Myxococcaceae bacterium]
MERKSGSTATVAAAEVTAALGRTNTLTSEEEKALRMRHGAKVDLRAPLPRAAGTNAELADELLLMEMQLLRSVRARGPVRAVTAGIRDVGQNPTKNKIVRALRKKK